MSKILLNLKHYFERCLKNGTKALNAEYESYLFKKDKPSTFKSHENELFTGIIRGVSFSGKLCVQLENTLEEFDLKELKLMY
jgi:BirA family biotin operon repressor/biotin-[acetyl-CoA-carboxylase] ligase